MTARKINCIDNKAYLEVAKKQAAALRKEAMTELALQIAMYVAERTMFGRINDMKETLARRRLDMARGIVAHASWPGGPRDTEPAFIQEIMGEKRPTPNYTNADVAEELANANAYPASVNIEREAQRIGLGISACVDNRTLRGLALAKTDLVGYTMRVEEARANKLGERRVSRQLAIIAMGKGRVAEALHIGNVGASANEIVAGTINETMNSGMAYFKFANERWNRPPGYEPGISTPPRILRDGQALVEIQHQQGQSPVIVAMSNQAADDTVRAHNVTTNPNPEQNPWSLGEINYSMIPAGRARR